MYTLKITSQFKKDLKRIQNNPTKITHLKEVLQLLEQDGMCPIGLNLTNWLAIMPGLWNAMLKVICC